MHFVFLRCPSKIPFVLPILPIAMGVAALAVAQENKEKSSIEGVWEGGVGPFDPKTKTYEEGGYILTITKTTITARTTTGEDYGEGTYTIDPEKGTIDVVGTKGDLRGQTFLGIYSLQRDTLLWATTRQGTGQRPTKLEHNRDAASWLITLKRKH